MNINAVTIKKFTSYNFCTKWSCIFNYLMTVLHNIVVLLTGRCHGLTHLHPFRVSHTYTYKELHILNTITIINTLIIMLYFCRYREDKYGEEMVHQTLVIIFSTIFIFNYLLFADNNSSSASILRIFWSTINVAKGNKDAAKQISVFIKFHFFFMA